MWSPGWRGASSETGLKRLVFVLSGGQRVRSYMPMIIASCIIDALPVISLTRPEVDQGIGRKQQLNTALV